MSAVQWGRYLLCGEVVILGGGGRSAKRGAPTRRRRKRASARHLSITRRMRSRREVSVEIYKAGHDGVLTP